MQPLKTSITSQKIQHFKNTNNKNFNKLRLFIIISLFCSLSKVAACSSLERLKDVWKKMWSENSKEPS